MMKINRALACAGIIISALFVCPITVLADSMDDYAGYDYMKAADKQKLKDAGITNYQRKQIETLCDKLGIDSKQYIDDNYYGILIGVKQKELENAYITSQGYEDSSEMVNVDGVDYELSHNYKYDYAQDKIVDNSMYYLDDTSYTNTDDSFVNHYKEWEMTPAFDWCDGSYFHNIDESDHIMRVYVDGVSEAAAAMAISSGESTFMLEDVSKDGEITVTYYVNGEPSYVQKTGNAYLNEYGLNGTKYFDLEGNELTSGQLMDKSNDYYEALSPELKQVNNVKKQQNACQIRALLENAGGDTEELKAEYEAILENIDEVSAGELFERVVELEQQRREIKAQKGAVMEEATHYLRGDIDINPEFADVDASYAEEVQKYILQYVNEIRAKNGLGPVEMSSDVMGAFADTRAIEACYYMDCKHRRPDNSELQFSGLPVSENLSCVVADVSAQQVARLAVDGWMKSYGHRLNILDEGHVTMNIGVAAKIVDGKITYYIAQEFADISSDNLDTRYADVDTSVIEPKVKVATGAPTYTDDAGNEFVNIAGQDANAGIWTHPVVGDVISIDGKVPNRMTTIVNGSGTGHEYNVVLYDANNSVVCMTTLVTQSGPPDYVTYPYVYIGFYEISGTYGQFVPVGSDSQTVSGNISNYWQYDEGDTHTGGNWELVNKYGGY